VGISCERCVPHFIENRYIFSASINITAKLQLQLRNEK
jgi:hypothetical protein